MNFLKIALIFVSIFTGFTSAYSQRKFAELPVYKGKYLGQTIPGMDPVEFASGIFSKVGAINTIFSPGGDEFYFTTDVDGNNEGDICWMKLKDGVWSSPVPVPFNSPYTDNDIVMSRDGFRVFWRSWRPIPGNTQKEKRSYLWTAQRTEDGWSKAALLDTEIGYLMTGYPAISNNGTLYIPFRSSENVGESDIYLSRFVNGRYSAPESLGSVLNTKYIEGDMCISHDESFLVVSCWNRPDNTNGSESDLYISFRNSEGKWSELINMGAPFNNSTNENCPTISPDGKYFFFLQYDPAAQVSRTYWVDIQTVKNLKPDYIK